MDWFKAYERIETKDLQEELDEYREDLNEQLRRLEPRDFIRGREPEPRRYSTQIGLRGGRLFRIDQILRAIKRRFTVLESRKARSRDFNPFKVNRK